MSKKITYEIYEFGDEEAGIPSFANEVFVKITNSFPEEDPSFEEELREFLAEWFDTPNVVTIKTENVFDKDGYE